MISEKNKNKIVDIILYSVLLLIIDAVFLYAFMIKKYSKMIENIQGSAIRPRYTFIILSYLLMVLGLHIFVLPKIQKIEDCVYGFLFGLIVYGVYDFVCASIFEKWDLKIMVVDVLWGATLYSIICLIYYFVKNSNNRK